MPFFLIPSHLGGVRPGQSSGHGRRGRAGAASLSPRGGHGRPDKLRGGPSPLPFWEGRRAVRRSLCPLACIPAPHCRYTGRALGWVAAR